ncbi:MAG: hypothetical protein ACQEUT_08460 [Bacillota bacterium]
MKRRKRRYKRTVIMKQKKYKELRRLAHEELSILKEHYQSVSIYEEEVLRYILYHLTASQKEISYFGLRGIFVGMIAAIFTFSFNGSIYPQLVKLIDSNAIAGFILSVIMPIIFFSLFLLAVWEPFWSDKKRRDQLYINEYMIELIKKELES